MKWFLVLSLVCLYGYGQDKTIKQTEAQKKADAKFIQEMFGHRNKPKKPKHKKYPTWRTIKTKDTERDKIIDGEKELDGY